MAEKYRARNNDLEKLDEEMPEKSEKELRKESGTKVAAKGAAFAPGVGGKIVDMASKTKVGQDLLNNADKTLARNPIAGRMMKKADDQGLVNTADKAVDMLSKNPNDVGNSSANKLGDSNSLGQNNSENSTEKSTSSFNLFNKNKNENNNSTEQNSSGNSMLNNILGFGNTNLFKGFFRKYLIIGCVVFFVFLMLMTIVVSATPFANLDLTNKSTSIIGTGDARNCTSEELESSLVYLGDSRVLGMESTLNNENIKYIAEVGKGYNWLKDTAYLELDNVIQNNTDSVIILGLGVNDLYNIDNYITYYNELMDKYPENTFFVLSVNPVNESAALSNGYSVTNEDINLFNEKLRNSFSENYIDSNSSLSTIGSSDGLHYDNNTNLNIHNAIISSINSSGKVMCVPSGDLAVSLETVAMWYIENVDTYQRAKSGKGTGTRKYYQTPFGNRKFGDDCTEFVAAYMSFISGVDVPESYSGEMVNPNGEWAQSVQSAGWKAYSSDEIGELQLGDILIANSGSLYSTKGYHGEIYINETETFGWGSIKKSYPTSNTITRSVEGSHVHFRDGGHDYITVYRYQGS